MADRLPCFEIKPTSSGEGKQCWAMGGQFFQFHRVQWGRERRFAETGAIGDVRRTRLTPQSDLRTKRRRNWKIAKFVRNYRRVEAAK